MTLLLIGGHERCAVEWSEAQMRLLLGHGHVTLACAILHRSHTSSSTGLQG